MDAIRFAMGQINPTVGDLAGNRDKIVKFISDARSLGCDIITFPELSVTGYPPEDLLLKPRFVEDSSAVLREIAHKAGKITVILGCVDRVKDDVFNAAALIQDERSIYIYHKICLPNYGVFDEKRYFKAGNACFAFRFGGAKIGVNICEDIWEAEGPARFEALNMGAPIIINISASPFYSGRQNLRENMLLQFTRDTNSVVFYNNLVGGQDELVFDGASMVAEWKSGILARGKPFEEDLVLFDLNVEEFLRARRAPRKRALKAHFKSEDLSLKRIPIRLKPPFPPRRIERFGSVEEIYKALVLGVRDYILKNGFKKAVLGISGGIDSAVVACIAADAIGADNVIGAVLPSPYTKEETRSDAVNVAKNLGMAVLNIPITNLFQAYLKTLKKEFKGKRADVTEENIQARIRGNLLMALSNKFGWLVLTTGNKSEMATGYCTLYGDMAGGFAVIKDVPKIVVYQLAEYKNAVAGKKLIPEGVIKRAPTAELKPGQKDQDVLPPYSTLDSILKLYVEEDKSYHDIVGQHFNPKTVKAVLSMVDRSEYKRRQAPPGIKITPRAFGRDRRFPITNKYIDAGKAR